MKYMYCDTKRGIKLKSLCYNSTMPMKKVIILSLIFAMALSQVPFLSAVHADTNVDFQVNVREALSVSITSPTTGASGNIDEFLRNRYTLSVTSNASSFTASMYSVSTTNLTNRAINTQTIPTLSSSSTRGSFPSNYWGYSLGSGTYNGNTYTETVAGNNSSTY